MIASVPDIKFQDSSYSLVNIVKWENYEPWGQEGPQEIILSHSPASEEDCTKYTLEK